MVKAGSGKTRPKPRPGKSQAAEIRSLSRRLQEAEETLRAIREGAVDGLVVSGQWGEQVFTLQAADRPYRQLVEQMAEGALALTMQGMIIFCNTHFAHLLGVPLEQVMGTFLSQWIIEEDAARYQRLLARAQEGSAKAGLRLALAKGQALPVHLSLSLLQTDEGPKLTGVVLDLSERKRVIRDLQEAWRAVRQLNQDLEQRVADRTAQLEKSNRRVTEILESITDAFYAVDAGWHLTYVNRRTEELWHRQRENLLGTLLWELFPNRKETMGYREHLRAMRERLPVHWENPSPNNDFWFDVNAYPTADGGLAVYLHDITERKRAEEALRRRTEELQAIMEAVPTAVFITRDPSSRTITGNRAARELVELPSSANLSKTAPEAERPTTWQEMRKGVPIAPEDLPMQQAAHGTEVHDYEMDLVFNDGTVKSVLANATPLRDENGNPQGGITVLADVTGLKRAEESLWQALHRITVLNRQLEERAIQLEFANKELEAFSYSVSHDLRTPLISVQDFARWLQDEYAAGLPVEAQRYIQFIRTGVREMDQLIQALLQLSHLSRQDLKRQMVSMEGMVREVLQQPETQRPDLTLDFRHLPNAEADPVLLRQVWVNLIANAFKFTRKCVNPRIEIGCTRRDDEDSVYYVRDNGVGFDMEQADRLFGIFQRLHDDQEYEGSGIGLAIVQRIIRRHGGRIWAEGRVGEGATFYFTLKG